MTENERKARAKANRLAALARRRPDQMGGGVKGQKRAITKADLRTLGSLKLELAQMIDDLTYRKAFRRRLIDGTLPSGVEQMVWYFVKGKPKETVTVEGAVRFSWKPREDVVALQERLATLQAENAALRAALPKALPAGDVVEAVVLEPR